MAAGAAIGGAVIGAVSSRQAAKTAASGARQAGEISAAQQARNVAAARTALSRTLAPSFVDLTAGVNRARAFLDPTARAGGAAFQQQAALSGALGQAAQARAFEGFQESPEQAFIREQQEQSVLRSATATGGLGGGNVLEELQRRAAGRAAQDIQGRFQRLGAVAAPGLEAKANIANLFTSLGTSKAQLRTGLGRSLANVAVGQGSPEAQFGLAAAQARAAGQLGLGSAIQQGLGQAAQLGAFSGSPQQQFQRTPIPQQTLAQQANPLIGFPTGGGF